MVLALCLIDAHEQLGDLYYPLLKAFLELPTQLLPPIPPPLPADLGKERERKRGEEAETSEKQRQPRYLDPRPQTYCLVHTQQEGRERERQRETEKELRHNNVLKEQTSRAKRNETKTLNLGTYLPNLHTLPISPPTTIGPSFLSTVLFPPSLPLSPTILLFFLFFSPLSPPLQGKEASASVRHLKLYASTLYATDRPLLARACVSASR
ncbi:hypothetical protein F4810DRAFT_472210 [Camillea tinctor]|nr:hypothetical protein F4810DRAFT_472210 [Camillea tinctor]